MAEAAVAAAIDRELERRRCYVVNITGTGVGRNGVPDRLVCHLGHFLAVEIKSRTGTVRKLQRWELERVAAAGGTAIVARCVEDVRAALDEIEAEVLGTEREAA
jgi:Holliday junction resolvase